MCPTTLAACRTPCTPADTSVEPPAAAALDYVLEIARVASDNSSVAPYAGKKTIDLGEPYATANPPIRVFGEMTRSHGGQP